MASKKPKPKPKPKPVPLEVVEHADGTEPDAYILAAGEKRIVEYCRSRDLKYDDVDDYLSNAYWDKTNQEEDADHEEFICLRAFKPHLEAALERMMDHFGGPISFIEMTHDRRDIWRFVVEARIDGRQCSAEITLRDNYQ